MYQDAEIAGLVKSPEAFKLYDIAVKWVMTNLWSVSNEPIPCTDSQSIMTGFLKKGWVFFLWVIFWMFLFTIKPVQARQPFCKMWCWRPGKRTSTARDHSTLTVGCTGNCVISRFPSKIRAYFYSLCLRRNHLTTLVGTRSQYPLKRSIFSADVAVQTDTIPVGTSSRPHTYDQNKASNQGDQESTLSAADLASILKWSKDISSDINLSSGAQDYLECDCLLKFHPALQRLTEIATG